MGTDKSARINEVLANIKTKISNCEPLAKTLEDWESNYAALQNDNYTIEQGIIKTYLNLIQICKQKNII